MNQKITQTSSKWLNEVLKYIVYKIDPQNHNQQIVLRTGIYETMHPTFEHYLMKLLEEDQILCNVSQYNDNYTFYDLSKTKLLASTNVSDYVYVKYKKDVSVGCCHQCSGFRIVCKICNNEYICQQCHNDNEDHEFEFKAIRCNYCDSMHQKLSINCQKCLQILCNVYCEKCYWASDYDYFISSQQHVCPDEDADCSICQEPLHYSKYTSLKCSHRFHTACLSLARQNSTHSCPLCRLIMPRDNNLTYQCYQIQNTNKNKVALISCHDCNSTTEDYQGCLNICLTCQSTNCTIQMYNDKVSQQLSSRLKNPQQNSIVIADILEQFNHEEQKIYKQIINEHEQKAENKLTPQTQLNVALQIKYLKDKNVEIMPAMFLNVDSIKDKQ